MPVLPRGPSSEDFGVPITLLLKAQTDEIVTNTSPIHCFDPAAYNATAVLEDPDIRRAKAASSNVGLAGSPVFNSLSSSRSRLSERADSAVSALARAIQTRDPALSRHCERIATMCSAMGLLLGLDPEAIRTLRRSAYVHDVGKIALPDRVLFKTSRLDPSEWELMKAHPVLGEEMCRNIPGLASLLPIIRHHHEHWDGSGYPDKLRGEQIPLLARILQMADIYDALTSERLYKSKYSPSAAIGVMKEETGKGWRDPNLMPVVEASLPLLQSASFWASGEISLGGLALALRG